ncbi:nitroreductase family protein [Chloroflexota bacterium]
MVSYLCVSFGYLLTSLAPPGFAAAPVFIIVCGDPRTKDAYPLSSVLDLGPSHFYSSLASAFIYMHLAATALGLGSQWVSATARPFMQCLIKELLGIPLELQIYGMMAVGYPASEPKPRMVRAREEMVRYDGYDKTRFRAQEEVRDYIKAVRGESSGPG